MAYFMEDTKPPLLTQLSKCSLNLMFSGGLNMKAQEAALRLGPDIVVATPGRLIDHLHNAPSFSLDNIEILILDEADRYENLFTNFLCIYTVKMQCGPEHPHFIVYNGNFTSHLYILILVINYYIFLKDCATE